MIYLVRHGQSVANINKKFCGITDVELTELGMEEAAKAGKSLKDVEISRIFSSPLKRAKNTAEIIADEIGFNKKDIVIENCLTEVNFGIFENLTWQEIVEEYAEESENWVEFKHRYKFPKGEGYDDIMLRISNFFDNVHNNSLIVTHYGVIQGLLLYFKVADDISLWDYHISNCDILVFDNKKLIKIIKNSI